MELSFRSTNSNWTNVVGLVKSVAKLMLVDADDKKSWPTNKIFHNNEMINVCGVMVDPCTVTTIQ